MRSGTFMKRIIAKDLMFALNAIQNYSGSICIAYIYELNVDTGLKVR